jgi:hypothetical protein
MEKTIEEKMFIANEILKQLGGHKFVVMTGAKDIYALDSGVQMRLPGGGGFCRNGINKVRITLNSLDLYGVEFLKVRKVRGSYELGIEGIKAFYGVYGDMLQAIFKQETGLNTHL